MHQSTARSPHIVALFGCVLALGACSVEDSDVVDEVGDDEQVGDGDDDATTGESLPAPTLARGISIAEVEINQGTRIPIGNGSEWVDGVDRLGFLISSRDSLLRIHYTVDEGWTPRPIEARLTLGLPDGTTQTLSNIREVDGDSQPYSLNGTFYFGLVADEGQTVAGTTYQVELWETEGGAGEGFAEGANINPAAGARLIGFETIPMQIKVVLVPIEYNGSAPNLSEDVQATVVNNLYEQNPVTEILYDVHSPVPYDGTLTSLGSLLPVMSQLRNAEGADPNVYYHALVDVGSASLGGVLGISNLASDQKADASSRVSATVLWSANPSIGADTFTHEHGHAQGLSHVECPNGGAAGPDPAYPHANGRIGNSGFGIRRFLLFDPDDAFDYMSYCGPSWVSDWTWNKTYQRIKTLTSWDFEGAAGALEPEATVLIGALYPDGSREWWTVPGAIDPEQVSGQDRFEFEVDGELIEAWGAVSTLSDGQTQWVKVELPAELEDIGAISHVRGDSIEAIDPGQLGSEFAVVDAWKPSFD